MCALESMSRTILVSDGGALARRAVSSSLTWSDALSRRSPMSSLSTALASSSYVARGSCRMSSFTGRGRASNTSPSAKPPVSSASLTRAVRPLAHRTCAYTWEPPGPSIFFPRFSASSSHSFRARTLSAFEVFGCLVSGHCFSNAVIRCVYVSFSAGVRSPNHRSAWNPYRRFTLIRLIICLSVSRPSLSIWASISRRNCPGSRLGSSSPS